MWPGNIEYCVSCPLDQVRKGGGSQRYFYPQTIWNGVENTIFLASRKAFELVTILHANLKSDIRPSSLDIQ